MVGAFYETRTGRAVLVLRHIRAFNAIDSWLINSLSTALSCLAHVEAGITVLSLHGSGHHFCTGGASGGEEPTHKTSSFAATLDIKASQQIL